eukprot:TRINITY_DN2774_c0_g1_i1.p1 TRINITY_DN2774_c0_g1~~TRINITY_DN2774_c0_g1_i1.p1  ORF type:complete len:1333 (-),score=383.68 TRINITY_DN2774_c0_g1_i1:3738-7736(-)
MEKEKRQSRKKKKKLVKTILIGDPSVGKTSLMHKFSNGDEADVSQITPTDLIDLDIQDIVIGPTNYRLQIWDTPGKERYDSLTSTSYYHGVDSVILVSDCTDPAALSSFIYWMKYVREFAKEDVMVIFALNKVDDYRRRVISTFDFLRFAHEQQVAGLEVSAKTGYHVFDLFRMALLGETELHDGMHGSKGTLRVVGSPMKHSRMRSISVVGTASTTRQEQSPLDGHISALSRDSPSVDLLKELNISDVRVVTVGEDEYSTHMALLANLSLQVNENGDVSIHLHSVSRFGPTFVMIPNIQFVEFFRDSGQRILALSLNSPRVCWLVLMSSRRGYIAEILRRMSYFFPERDVLISDLNVSKIESIVFDAFKDVDEAGKLVDQVSEWDKAGKLVFSYLSIPLKGELCHPLSVAINMMSGIRELDFSFCDFGDEDADRVNAVLASAFQAHVIDVTGNRFRRRGLEWVDEIMRAENELKCLRFSKNDFLPKTLSSLFLTLQSSKHCKIEELVCDGVRFDEVSVSSFCPFLVSTKTLRKFSHSLGESTIVVQSSSQLDDPLFTHLVNSISLNTSLEEICLDGHIMDSQNDGFLKMICRRNKKLQQFEVDVDSQPITLLGIGSPSQHTEVKRMFVAGGTVQLKAKVFVEGRRGEHSIAEVGHLDLVIKNRRLDIECSSKDGEMVESHRIKDVGNLVVSDASICTFTLKIRSQHARERDLCVQFESSHQAILFALLLSRMHRLMIDDIVCKPLLDSMRQQYQQDVMWPLNFSMTENAMASFWHDLVDGMDSLTMSDVDFYFMNGWDILTGRESLKEGDHDHIRIRDSIDSHRTRAEVSVIEDRLLGSLMEMAQLKDLICRSLSIFIAKILKCFACLRRLFCSAYLENDYEPIVMKEIATEMESHLVILTAVLEERVSQSFDHYLFTIISSWERAFVQCCAMCFAQFKQRNQGYLEWICDYNHRPSVLWMNAGCSAAQFSLFAKITREIVYAMSLSYFIEHGTRRVPEGPEIEDSYSNALRAWRDRMEIAHARMEGHSSLSTIPSSSPDFKWTPHFWKESETLLGLLKSELAIQHAKKWVLLLEPLRSIVDVHSQEDEEDDGGEEELVGDVPGGKKKFLPETLATAFVGVLPRVLDRFVNRIEKRMISIKGLARPLRLVDVLSDLFPLDGMKKAAMMSTKTGEVGAMSALILVGECLCDLKDAVMKWSSLVEQKRLGKLQPRDRRLVAELQLSIRQSCSVLRGFDEENLVRPMFDTVWENGFSFMLTVISLDMSRIKTAVEREESIAWNTDVDEVAEEAVELLALSLKTQAKPDANAAKEDVSSAVDSTEHRSENHEEES